MNPKTYNLKLTEFQIKSLIDALRGMKLMMKTCGNEDCQTLGKIEKKASDLLETILKGE